jgi:hypothetical protein
MLARERYFDVVQMGANAVPGKRKSRKVIMRKSMSCTVGAAIAAIAALNGVGTAAAGPLPVNVAALKTATPNDLIDVRVRGGAVAAGIALGLFGAAVASQYYYPYPYYYYPPYPRAYYPGYPYYGPYWGYRPYVYGYPRYRFTHVTAIIGDGAAGPPSRNCGSFQVRRRVEDRTLAPENG